MSSARAIAFISKAGVERRIEGRTSNFGVERVEPINAESAFDLASITKIMATTTLIALLVDTGEIRLNQKISNLIPEWRISEKEDLTLEDLLRHESGLEEWRPFYITCKSPDEVFSKIVSLPLKYPKRSGFHYSDLNFMVLGRVIEIVHKAPISRAFQEEIARPLSLTNTSFSAPINQENVVATSIGDSIEAKMVRTKIPYEVPEDPENFNRWRTQVLSGEINDGNSFHVFQGTAGHAGLFSTLNDLTRYIEGLLEGFISRKTLEEFSKPRTFAEQGIGFKRFRVPGSSFPIGHFGFTGTGFAIDIERKTGLVYLGNRLHTKSEYRPMTEIWSEEFKEFSSRG
ncbi:MAG: serine hydrolase domain-containing protein [Candidatus Nanopelagicaceae bacterium]